MKPDDFQASHGLKKKDTVTVKFKHGKQKRSVRINKESLRNKSDVFIQLSFSGSFPRGFGIILSMLNLMKDINLQKFIILLTLKNFFKLTIWTDL